MEEIKTLDIEDYPYLLCQIHRLPKSMEIIGKLPPETYKYLCVVGSRSHSEYGQKVCEQLIAGLAGYPIVIVSGLAKGIDSIAHASAIDAGLKTVAFPGSGLAPHVIYPQSNKPLAERIVASGGALLSPFKREQGADVWTFPTRNTLMAGISHATLVIEGREKSGTWSTIEAALSFGRDLFIVPGSIFSDLSAKPLEMLKEGARPVTSSRDIIEALGLNLGAQTRDLFESDEAKARLSTDEKILIEKIMQAPISRDNIIRDMAMPVGYVTSILMELELKGLIVERGGVLYGCNTNIQIHANDTKNANE